MELENESPFVFFFNIYFYNYLTVLMREASISWPKHVRTLKDKGDKRKKHE